MKGKTFDCVEMKNAVQAKLRKDFEGLTPEEERERIRRNLDESDSLVARKWRRLVTARKAGVGAR